MADLSKDGAYDNNFNKTDTVQSDTKTQIIQLFRQIKKPLYLKQHAHNISVWVIKRCRRKAHQDETKNDNCQKSNYIYIFTIQIQYVLE